MIKILDKTKCCGCSACEQICPQHCIKLIPDNKGFRYPRIDHQICIDCNLCERICPVLNPKKGLRPLKTLACKNPNLKIRLQSSSGGAFFQIASYVINSGGVVFGVRFDNKWDVVHWHTDIQEDIQYFQGSKYVQSYVGNSFEDCRRFLRQGTLVLFSGTPCQIAGLKNYLGKEYENLITVDTICHAVPSPKVWKKFLAEICSQLTIYFSDIRKINFRDKSNGWATYQFSVDYLKNGEKQNYHDRFVANPYGKLFLQHLSIRPSCSNCPAKEGKSHSDITLGDFWGVDKVKPEINDNQGVGLILVNSAKGSKLIDKLDLAKEDIDFNSAINHNPSWKTSALINADTESFFFYINHGGKLKNVIKCSFSYRITRFLIKRIVSKKQF